MPQASLPPDPLQDFCAILPEPGGYFCKRWRDQVDLITSAPEVSLLIIALALLVGWLLTRYHYKKRLEDTEERLKLKDDTIAVLENEKATLRDSIREAVEQKQMKTAPLLKPSQTIYPRSSKNGVLWELTPEARLSGPFCPTHRAQLLYWPTSGYDSRRVFNEDEWLNNVASFVCSVDGEEFTFLRPLALKVGDLRAQAMKQFQAEDDSRKLSGK